MNVSVCLFIFIVTIFLISGLLLNKNRFRNYCFSIGICVNNIYNRNKMLRNKRNMESQSSTEDDDDILDVSKCNFEGDFDTQVDNLLQRVRLTRYQVEQLQLLVNDLEDALRMRWRKCKIHPFGSIISGLGIKTSDVDCYVEVGEHPFTVYHRDPVILARNVIRQRHWIFDQIFAIVGAKVPILKFYHIPTGCRCDVNFKSPSGVRNSKLIAFLINLDSRALPLAIIIKYWSVVYSLTGTNRMPTYTLIMMVIFYLQVKGILPSVNELQDNVPSYIIDGWNTSFDTHYQHTNTNKETIYDLLGGFFQYYSTFKFTDDMIVPYLGYPLKKQVFLIDGNIPDEYRVYRDKVASKECPAIKLEARMCVQDPFEHNRNCGIAIYPKLVNVIMELIQYGAQMFTEKPSKDFLKALFNREGPRNNIRPICKENTGKVTKKKPKGKKRKLQNTINICVQQINKRKVKR